MRQYFYNNQETVENNNMSSTKAIEKTAWKEKDKITYLEDWQYTSEVTGIGNTVLVDGTLYRLIGIRYIQKF